MWIKICGIRDVATAQRVAALSPDAVGLNFFRGTPRCVETATAAKIVAGLPPEVEPVGVFVDEQQEAVDRECRTSNLRTVQLHGGESAETLRGLAEGHPERRLIRAWNLGPEGLEPLGEYLTQLDELQVRLAACLIDARVAGRHGGTGQPVDWQLLAREYNRRDWPPLILAGGLTADNVGRAIGTVRPWGVDVASGVESAPGIKDLSLVERFIAAAREAAV